MHNVASTMLDNRKNGVLGIFWKFARVGERLSPYVSLCCVVMAVSEVFLFPLVRKGRTKGRKWKGKGRRGAISCYSVDFY